MSRLSLPLILLVATLAPAVAGCGFYYGGDDDDCAYTPRADGSSVAPLELRNPETGQCEYVGGGWQCDDTCGACPAYDEGVADADPGWGYCYDSCSELDETTCMETDSCRAGFMDRCPPAADCDLESSLQFVGCWAVDQTGPIQGDCDGLNARECSRHDDCRAIHDNTGINNPGGPCTDASCLGGYVSCIEEPQLQDPGLCWQEALCDSIGPDCPSGSTPGVRDGCWTGACIALSDCEARTSCDLLLEDRCINRADCDPLYEGVDCVCDADGCSCSEWLFNSCTDADTQP